MYPSLDLPESDNTDLTSSRSLRSAVSCPGGRHMAVCPDRAGSVNEVLRAVYDQFHTAGCRLRAPRRTLGEPGPPAVALIGAAQGPGGPSLTGPGEP